MNASLFVLTCFAVMNIYCTFQAIASPVLLILWRSPERQPASRPHQEPAWNRVTWGGYKTAWPAIASFFVAPCGLLIRAVHPHGEWQSREYY
jgi:hypothetical protein